MYEKAIESSQEGVAFSKRFFYYLKEKSEIDQRYIKELKALQDKHKPFFKQVSNENQTSSSSSTNPASASTSGTNSLASTSSSSVGGVDQKSPPGSPNSKKQNRSSSFLKMFKKGSKKDFKDSSHDTIPVSGERLEYVTTKTSYWQGMVAVFDRIQTELDTLDRYTDSINKLADSCNDSTIKYEKVILGLKKGFDEINSEEKRINTRDEEVHLRNWGAKLFKSLEEVERGRLSDAFEAMKSISSANNDRIEDELTHCHEYSSKILSVYIEEDLQEFLDEHTQVEEEQQEYTLQTVLHRRYAVEGDIWKETPVALKEEDKKIYLFKPGEAFKITGIISLDGAQIHDLDPSLGGRPFCFQVHVVKGTNTIKRNSVGDTIIYFSANSEEEKNAWTSKIATICYQKTDKSVDYPRFTQMNVQMKNVIRELNLEVMAAKQLPRDDYICEIGFSTSNVTKCVFFAKTAVQFNTTLPTWCEKFSFKDLDKDWKYLIIHFCSKKSNKTKRLAYLEIPLVSRGTRREWIRMIPYSVELPSPEIQVEYEFKEDLILPFEDYDELYKIVRSENMDFLTLLQELHNTPEEMETLSNHIFNILSQGGGDPLVAATLCRLLSHEINSTQIFQTLFRGNSLVMRVAEKFLSSSGIYYIKEALGSAIKEVVNDRPYLEVNPRNAIESAVQANRVSLLRYVNKFLDCIFQAVKFLPNEIRVVFQIAAKEIQEKWGKELKITSISAIFFLRFVVPKIMTPTKNGLVESQPDAETTRSLLMIAKVIQRFANFTKETKEEYLQPIVDQLSSRRLQLEDFINELSNANGQHRKLPVFHSATPKHLSYLARDLTNKSQVIQDKIFKLSSQIHSQEDANRFENLKTLKNVLSKIEFKSKDETFFHSMRGRTTSFNHSPAQVPMRNPISNVRNRTQSDIYAVGYTANNSNNEMIYPNASATEYPFRVQQPQIDHLSNRSQTEYYHHGHHNHHMTHSEITSSFRAQLPPPIAPSAPPMSKSIENFEDIRRLSY